MAQTRRTTSYSFPKHYVRPIPFKAHKIDGFTPESLEHYYENEYGSSVRVLNSIEYDIALARESGVLLSDEVPLLARHAKIVDRIYMQELCLAGLAEDGGTNLEDLALERALVENFGSTSNWKDEFVAIAAAQSSTAEWIVLAWCERFERLLNVVSEDGYQALCGSVPLLAVDLRTRAYASEFGDDRQVYVETYLQNIHWGHVAAGFGRVLQSDSHKQCEPNDVTQITVAELNARITDGTEAPIILDIRHDDDRDRYTSRIAGTEWRDSFKVAEWVGELPKDKPVVVYCMYGFWVSQKVVEELRAEGIDARSLEGGVTAWRAMGLPSTEY
ncbi:Fe-Mn family superoxide dismutase [uncultured Ruegeria sp.]|uniref:Fe-Mn family superoxide dismutase n=1 Tax=uncultured Ruegeria sp. TaxID=259304 RepID=UPI0026174B0F|nr:Fe-Mn family superoxide dismutase [uncultured Ruegeria sp.]